MKRILLVISVVLITISSNAQLWKMRRWEVMGAFGPSMFFGDIGGFSQSKNILGFRDMSFRQTRFNINGSLKYRILQDVSIRLSLSYGILHATDDRGSNETRLYEATTSIFEPAIIGEYYFIKNGSESSYLFIKGKQRFIEGLMRSLDFYAFTGIAGLKYKVKGNDALIDLGLKSKGFTAAIPVGVGADLVFSPSLNFGVEFGGRYCFSDYIDGYTSQFSKANDVYYFFNFSVTYKLKTGPHGLPSLRR